MSKATSTLWSKIERGWYESVLGSIVCEGEKKWEFWPRWAESLQGTYSSLEAAKAAAEEIYTRRASKCEVYSTEARSEAAHETLEPASDENNPEAREGI